MKYLSICIWLTLFCLWFANTQELNCRGINSCSDCISSKDLDAEDPPGANCQWCEPNNNCFGSADGNTCDPSNTVTSNFPSKCIKFIGLPLVTGIVVLTLSICVPLCCVAIIIGCTMKARSQANKQPTSTIMTRSVKKDTGYNYHISQLPNTAVPATRYHPPGSTYQNIVTEETNTTLTSQSNPSTEGSLFVEPPGGFLLREEGNIQSDTFENPKEQLPNTGSGEGGGGGFILEIPEELMIQNEEPRYANRSGETISK